MADLRNQDEFVATFVSNDMEFDALIDSLADRYRTKVAYSCNPEDYPVLCVVLPEYNDYDHTTDLFIFYVYPDDFRAFPIGGVL